MMIEPPVLTSAAAAMGALMGGAGSFAAAVYTQHKQQRLQRVEREITRRETVYAEFIVSASHLLLDAYVRDEIAVGGDEQRLIGLVNRIRLFAPAIVVEAAEAVVRAIVEISLMPSLELRDLAKAALSKNPNPDPFLAFSRICRADLDEVRRTLA